MSLLVLSEAMPKKCGCRCDPCNCVNCGTDHNTNTQNSHTLSMNTQKSDSLSMNTQKSDTLSMNTQKSDSLIMKQLVKNLPVDTLLKQHIYR